MKKQEEMLDIIPRCKQCYSYLGAPHDGFDFCLECLKTTEREMLQLQLDWHKVSEQINHLVKNAPH